MKKIKKLDIFQIVFFLVLLAYTIILFFALLWAFTTSVKQDNYFLYHQIEFPFGKDAFTLDNYAFLFDDNFVVRANNKYFGLGDMISNSLMYVVGCSLIQTSVMCFMAYLVAKFRYKFSSIIYWVVVIAMTIPVVGTDISTIQILREMGVYDTLLGNYVLKFAFPGMYFLVFHAAFESIPDSYAEAASIDGAGETRIFIQIILPLIMNMFFTIFLITFITLWNDYSSPLLYWPSKPTLSYGVWAVTTGAGGGNANQYQKVPIRMALSLFMALPLLLIFMIFKNRIMNKVSMGGIKE